MNINNRFCTQEGHNMAQVTHLCVYQECKLKNQQCCRLCITQEIHQHGQSDNEHIRLKSEIQNNNQLLPQLDKQDDQYKNVMSIDYKNRKYNLKQIDHGDKFYAAAISNDEKYLVYGGENLFKILDLKENKIIKEIKDEGRLNDCQFTLDSSQLFVAYGSFLIGYDVKMNFKKTFKYNIQALFIEIIIIQNQYLLASKDSKIVKIDIKRKKQLFKLQNYGRVLGMDFDQKKDFLINRSIIDRSLNIWHGGKKKNYYQKIISPLVFNLLNIINKQQLKCLKYRLQMQLIYMENRFNQEQINQIERIQ